MRGQRGKDSVFVVNTLACCSRGEKILACVCENVSVSEEVRRGDLNNLCNAETESGRRTFFLLCHVKEEDGSGARPLTAWMVGGRKK